MKRAKRLAPGDRIALIAPSSAFERAAFRRAVAWLAARGYRAEHRRDVFAKEGYLAGTDVRRRREWSSALAGAADAIFCARGGYGAMRLFLDDAPRAGRGKLLMGMSDATPLLNFMAAKRGTVAVHGPVLAGTLFAGLREEARARLFALLERPLMQVLDRGRDFRTIVPGDFSGTLWGGNLALLAATVGTPLEFRPRGRAVLFLEDVGEPPYRIDRMLAQLQLSGFLGRFAAIVLGDFTDAAGRVYAKREMAAFFAKLPGKKRPLLYGIASSHARMEVLLPIGGEVALRGSRLFLSPLVAQ